MAKRKSLKKRCSAVQRSNRAHRVCLKKVVKENGVASKQAFYHRNVIRIQNVKCRVLTKSERRSIFKRS